MKMHPVQSSHIEAVGQEGDTMEIHFKGNRKYTYPGVSAESADGIRTAESPGTALRQLGVTGTLIVEDE